MHIYKSFVDECIYILKLLIISISTFSTTNNKTITIEERGKENAAETWDTFNDGHGKVEKVQSLVYFYSITR